MVRSFQALFVWARWHFEEGQPSTGANPDGDGNILRVWEQAGISGSRTVKLPEGITILSTQPVNLRGEKLGDPINLKNGEFTFYLKAYAPASFVVEF